MLHNNDSLGDHLGVALSVPLCCMLLTSKCMTASMPSAQLMYALQQTGIHIGIPRVGPANQAIKLAFVSSLSVFCSSYWALYRCTLTDLRLRRYACMYCWVWTTKAWRGLVYMQLGNGRPSSTECMSTYGHTYGPLSLLHLVADSAIGS